MEVGQDQPSESAKDKVKQDKTGQDQPSESAKDKVKQDKTGQDQPSESEKEELKEKIWEKMQEKTEKILCKDYILKLMKVLYRPELAAETGDMRLLFNNKLLLQEIRNLYKALDVAMYLLCSRKDQRICQKKRIQFPATVSGARILALRGLSQKCIDLAIKILELQEFSNLKVLATINPLVDYNVIFDMNVVNIMEDYTKLRNLCKLLIAEALKFPYDVFYLKLEAEFADDVSEGYLRMKKILNKLKK